MDRREFTIKRPVKMYGVQPITMTIDRLISRFIKNWKDWTNGQEVKAQSFFDWIKNVCRGGNLFLEKVVNNEDVYKKSVPERFLGELIFGKQSYRRSKKHLWAAKSFSTNAMVLAPDVTLQHVRSAVQDLIELNFLIEFDISRVNQEQTTHLYSGLRNQQEKNNKLFRNAKILAYNKFWDDPSTRQTCQRVMTLISSEAQVKIESSLYALSAVRLLKEYESSFGCLEHISFKTRRFGENILMKTNVEENQGI